MHQMQKMMHPILKNNLNINHHVIYKSNYMVVLILFFCIKRGQEMELRPYQKECIEIIDNLPKGNHLIVMATGLGKTATFANFKRRGRVLILSHIDELVRQPQKYFEDATYGVEKADEHSNGEEIVSASVQSLSKDSRLKRYNVNDFDTIIIDEAHHAAAESYKKTFQEQIE